MLLILDGSSKVAQAAIANLIIKRRGAWRHLPPSDFATIIEQFGLPVEGNSALAGMLFMECVRTLEEEGGHVIQPSHHLPAELDDLRGDGCMVIYVGKDPEDAEGYDHVVETDNRTAEGIFEALLPVLEAAEKGS